MNHSQLGILPALPECDCQICRPEPVYDEIDRRCIDAILSKGWQTLLVGAECVIEGCCESDSGPDFAYTLGLGHHRGHPELFMSGLDLRLMSSVLNHLAEQVRAGHVFKHGDVVEGALAGVPVVLEQLADEHLEQTVPWSGWFHRRKPEALAVVWPTTTGVFSWQPGAPSQLDEMQPPYWRIPSPREGGVAVTPDWTFPIPAEQLVSSCTHVVVDGVPVLWAAHHDDGEQGDNWTFHCGASDHTIDTICAIHIAHLIRSAPSLREICGLELGCEAKRATPHVPFSSTVAVTRPGSEISTL